LYGDDVQVTADITAFKHASFGTDLLFQIGNTAAVVLPILPRHLLPMNRPYPCRNKQNNPYPRGPRHKAFPCPDDGVAFLPENGISV
jgi:hypothetical protein